MATNYFQQLGFGQSNPLAGIEQAQQLRANQFNYEQAQKQAAAQEEARKTQALQFQNEQQKQRAAQGAGAFYNALNSGNAGAALQIAKQYEGDINALGDPSFTTQTVAEMLKTPEGVDQLKKMSLGMVQMAGGAEQFAKFTAGQQPKQMTPYEQAQIGARQQEIAVSQQRLDIDREANKLKALEKAAASATNDLRKHELQIKIDEQKQKVDEAKSQKQADFQTAQSNIQNTISTLDSILSTPFEVINDATGPVNQMLPTLSQSTADFEELVKKFESQAFMAQIPQLKGSGALSDAEGKKLASALENMSLRQSPSKILENAQAAKSILERALKVQAEKYGQPSNVDSFLGRGQQATQQSVGRFKIEVIK